MYRRILGKCLFVVGTERTVSLHRGTSHLRTRTPPYGYLAPQGGPAGTVVFINLKKPFPDFASHFYSLDRLGNGLFLSLFSLFSLSLSLSLSLSFSFTHSLFFSVCFSDSIYLTHSFLRALSLSLFSQKCPSLISPLQWYQARKQMPPPPRFSIGPYA